MIRILTDFTTYSSSKRLAFFYRVIDCVSGNINFHLEASTLTILKTETEKYKVLSEKAKTGDRQQIAAMKEQQNVVDGLFKSLALTIEQQSFSESVALSSGFEVCKPRTPAQKSDFEIEDGEKHGSVILKAKAIKEAWTYIWQYSTSPSPSGEKDWSICGHSTQAKYELDGLEVGKSYSFRFAYVSPKGESKYSNPIQWLIR